MPWLEAPRGARPTVTSAAAPRGKPAELDRVTLLKAVEWEDGRLPAGASGTVVHVWSGGTIFEIEFTQPFHAVATVGADDIAA